MFKVVAKNDLMTFIAHDKDSRQKCVKAVQETINDIRQQKGEKFANLNNVTVSSYHKI
jgi:ribosome recycling factor